MAATIEELEAEQDTSSGGKRIMKEPETCPTHGERTERCDGSLCENDFAGPAPEVYPGDYEAEQ